ncbi:3-dehydroquinate synthase, partial [Candidatus Microgenomates bacterium]|nr:3-dehydroquinate synthase [Candidatus Microgenomates bacterium]
MKNIKLSFKNMSSSYTIFIGENMLDNISQYIPIERYSQVFVITDTNVAPHFLPMLLQGLPKDTKHISIAPGEKEKSITTLQHLWQAMIDAKCDRKTLVINLGGGVIGDMGGFAASTYLRGVDFVNIPTTLLSQVDESVGGKTMINFGGVKNNIGTFTQPNGIIIDLTTLRTLPKREFLSGFAEIIKYGIISDPIYFRSVTKKHPLKFTNRELEKIIAGSCAIKKSIIQEDEKEINGHRKLVNYGHTIGHAIESLSLETSTPLLHGEAISIGMLAEARLAER